MWRPQRDALAGSFRVAPVDLPGFGGTLPRAKCSISSLALALDEFMTDSGIDQAALVGWSMGAGVVLRYCELMGTDKLWGVTLIEDSPRLRPADDWPQGEYTTFAPEVVNGWFKAWEAGRRVDVLREIFAHGFVDPQRYEAVVDHLVQDGELADPDCALNAFRDAVECDFRRGLASLSVPTQLIFGALSRMSTSLVREYMAARIPGCELEVVEGCGHCLLWEKPEAVTDLLRSFLERVAAAQG